MNEVYCRARCIFVRYLRDGAKKKSRSRLNALRDRSIPAVFGGGARQSVGRQAADCNGATKKKTMMKKRRKCPGTRYRPGANTFPPGCLLCYILARRMGGLLKRVVVTFEHCRMLSFFTLVGGED